MTLPFEKYKGTNSGKKHLSTTLNVWKLLIEYCGDIALDSMTPAHIYDFMLDRMHAANKPWSEEQGMGVLRILTDRGTEYCGKPENHDYQLYLALNDIEHSKTKANHPQTNGICERFHKTVLQEFYQVAFRRKIYRSLEEVQLDLDDWITHYNNERTHQGKMCCGRTPIQTLVEGKEAWDRKVSDLNSQT